jgi:uncharacterized membrane protein
MVSALFRFVLDLCLLRATPADAPSQPTALVLAILAYLGVFTLDHALQQHSLPALLPALQLLLLLTVVVYFLLRAQQQSRYTQTLFSLLASSAVLSVIGILLQMGVPSDNPQQVHPLIAFSWLLLFGWSFVVDAHIFRHALERSLTIGMVIAVLIFAINQMLLAAWYLPTSAEQLS